MWTTAESRPRGTHCRAIDRLTSSYILIMRHLIGLTLVDAIVDAVLGSRYQTHLADQSHVWCPRGLWKQWHTDILFGGTRDGTAPTPLGCLHHVPVRHWRSPTTTQTSVGPAQRNHTATH